MFKKILIANRGEIACRVIKSAQEMGIKTVAVYSDADKSALHVQMADEAVHIGGSPASESYLVGQKIIAACKTTGAEAVHPGYGFLSENAAFCEQLTKEGLVFIGPPPKAIEAMGDKITSKKIAAEAGVATVPGHMGLIEDAEEAVKIARQITYPVMIKASAGGGGKGMRIAYDDGEAREGFARSKSEAASSFGDDRIFIEKFIEDPRHIEIQVLADNHGNCIYLGERECSIQRRHQKVIEEAPSVFLDEATRQAMGSQAVALAKAVDYSSAGTVEFIVDRDRNFYFLEMNTRLQVEHPVSEMITGVDLVEQMLLVAAGEKLALAQGDIKIDGWAMESRIYAEDPYRNFLPSVGRLSVYQPPEEVSSDQLIVRNDTGVYEGGEISTFYDPMIAKLCTWAPDRAGAIEAMVNALDVFEIEGVGHNIPFLQAVMGQERFLQGRLTTGYIAEEFPDGFAGVEPQEQVLKQIAAFVACASVIEQSFRNTMGGKERSFQSVILGAQRWDFDVEARGKSFYLCLSGVQSKAKIDWLPGQRIASVVIDGVEHVLQVQSLTNGFRIRHRGADLVFRALTPRVADLMELMPEKIPADMSRFLLCPMPGVVVGLNVVEGDIVEDGQSLAVVEAMKMENVLRAQKRAKVSKIVADVGAVLSVDAVILEFEEV
ncbi:MAG: acetyl/propionyl/methylcrotonyl-CoA carboxylase subunit alpha [Devosiaceae bacterium]|nr:acetyl/propionyl/methylcrotonyl-CoA carboxylase subunit alpha [Devosiaceae bacterium]